MSPTDPRHGTNAGYVAHKKEGSSVCQPCLTAGRRARKRLYLYGSNITTLGDRAHHIVVTAPRAEIMRAGISSGLVTRLRRGGPEQRVQRATRDRILAVGDGHVKVEGARRRLQALACLGWSSAVIAERIGVHHDNLSTLRRGDRTHYVHRDVAAKIAEVYAELCMTLAPPGRAASWTRTYAASRGWLPPLAWDDIDDPDETPDALRRTDGRTRAGKGSLHTDVTCRRCGVRQRDSGHTTNLCRDCRDVEAA